MKNKLPSYRRHNKKKLMVTGLISTVLLGTITPAATVEVSAEVSETTYSRMTEESSHKRKARKHKKHSRRNKRIHKSNRREDSSKNRDDNQQSSRYFGRKKRSDRWKEDERQEQNVVDESQNEDVTPEPVRSEDADTTITPKDPKRSEQSKQQPIEASSKAQAALNAVNELREKNGLPTLTYNAELGQAAQTVAQGNHDRNGLTHAHDDAAVEANGYTGDSALANIGYNSAGTSAEGAVNQFYGSAGHRKQMLAPYWTEFGYGEVNGPNGTYFTQFFGTQDINNVSEFNSYNQYIGSRESRPSVPLNSYNGE